MTETMRHRQLRWFSLLSAALGGALACAGEPVSGGAGGGGGGGQTTPPMSGQGGTGAAAGGTTGADPGCSDTVDNVPPSIVPPGGLPPDRVPMFVLLGFDDNAYLDGMTWTLDVLAARRNADGSPALATFFITAGFVSDFFRPVGGQSKEALIASWKRISSDGHEVANHTFSHGENLAGGDLATWQDEIGKTQDLFVETLGVERCKLWGFRTPFLGFSDSTFQALRGLGIRYDTSVEFGYDWWQPPGSMQGFSPGSVESGQNYYWPFTMDGPFPQGFYHKGISPIPGMWQFPVYTFNKISGQMASTVTGFDFNLWTKSQSEASFSYAEVLKQSLDQRLQGNRSPFAVGLHTDVYSEFNEDANTTWSNFSFEARRQALADFIDYALSKPEVRLVTYRQLIGWMRNPSPL